MRPCGRKLFCKTAIISRKRWSFLAGRLLEYGSAIRAGDETKLNVLLKEGRICKEKLEQGGD
jgi:hypothetical protein